ncbi:rubrerythrin family protein [Prosthecochloris sp. N3]|uniref:Rubrerythrin family protein n=1 Tax=Prosthecochloris ethylica TaxID=2743976 RepID=A0ABR9XPS9_9CHLB|nr:MULTISPECIES: rubrerythrin family protein [Prosthecochloris]MEC9487715.1 rubrerythrin family protein [Prosthecochloris sp.]MBF0587260.1 rubrerythrin family protein [Prosthecochloris ethylica]MBF0636046.1 rubrerythrin family protein [Prosthecochloris ethylica]NUK48473.1 rubrerythrin family protein [Prosthecochloris ethylica]RNA65799.1 rubrerythrin family protein [Prosthecochloris sp. ZM_2]
MDNDISPLLDESITLELAIARLYTLFHDHFTEDEDFWWQLAIEERNHAALLRNEIRNRNKQGAVPDNLLPEDLKEVRRAVQHVDDLISSFTAEPFSRTRALETAYEIENSIGEIHFQKFMERKSCSLGDELFKQLNQEDKDHANRISQYMQSQGLES